MKTRIFLSSLIALFSVAIYPAMERLANAERGYTDRIDNVFGGEEILLIFGLFVSMIIVVDGFDRYLFSKSEREKKKSSTPKAAASHTESEQSESKSL